MKYGIRPEHIDFGAGGIAAEVVVVEPMGAETELLVKVGGSGADAHAHDARPLERGAGRACIPRAAVRSTRTFSTPPPAGAFSTK